MLMERLMCCSKNGGTVVDWIMQNCQYQSGNVITTARHRVHSQSGGNSDTRSLRRTVFEDTAGKSASRRNHLACSRTAPAGGLMKPLLPRCMNLFLAHCVT